MYEIQLLSNADLSDILSYPVDDDGWYEWRSRLVRLRISSCCFRLRRVIGVVGFLCSEGLLAGFLLFFLGRYQTD